MKIIFGYLKHYFDFESEKGGIINCIALSNLSKKKKYSLINKEYRKFLKYNYTEFWDSIKYKKNSVYSLRNL